MIPTPLTQSAPAPTIGVEAVRQLSDEQRGRLLELAERVPSIMSSVIVIHHSEVKYTSGGHYFEAYRDPAGFSSYNHFLYDTNMLRNLLNALGIAISQETCYWILGRYPDGIFIVQESIADQLNLAIDFLAKLPLSDHTKSILQEVHRIAV